MQSADEEFDTAQMFVKRSAEQFGIDVGSGLSCEDAADIVVVSVFLVEIIAWLMNPFMRIMQSSSAQQKAEHFLQI